MPTAGKSISELDPIADPIPDDLDFPVAGVAGDNYRVQLPQILGRVPALPADVARTGQANVFSVGQTFQAHSAAGAGAVIDQPAPYGGTWFGGCVFNVNETITTVPDDNGPYEWDGIVTTVNANPVVGPSSGEYIPFRSQALSDPSCAAAIYQLNAGNFQSNHQGTGAASDIIAATFSAITSGGGAVDKLEGVYVSLQNWSAGSISTSHGVWIDSPYQGGAGAWTSHYGLLIGDQSGVGSAVNYAILSQGGTVQFSTGKPAAKGLVVQGAASQTANLQEWQNSSGTALAWVGPTGAFTVKGHSALGNSAVLDASKGGPQPTALLVDESFTGTVPSTLYHYAALQANFTVNGSGSGYPIYKALGAVVEVPLGNTQTGITQLTGASIGLYYGGNGSVNYAYGLLVSAFASDYNFTGTATGTVQNLIGTYTQIANGNNTSVGTGYALFVDSPAVNYGTWTANYGLYLADQSGAAAAATYAIYSCGGTVQFNTGKSTVKGVVVRAAASQTANLTEWQDSSGAALAKVDASGLIYPPQGASPPAWSAALKGALFFNSTTNKLMVAGASSWETVSSA